jgi:hypothetical protein
MSVVVRAGTAIINGSLVSLASDTTVTISTPDSSYPRFDLITLKSNGTVGYYTGTPEPALAVDLAKPETYVKPKPPSTPSGEVALAEVFVPAGATAIDKIMDRRIITGISAKQVTTGIFDVARIPDLDASKIVSGRFPMSRMPDGSSGYFLKAQGAGYDPVYALLTAGDIPSLDASKITSGRFPMDRMPDGASGYVIKGQGTGVNPAYGQVDWTELTGKPSTFPPSAHASTHKQGGADEVIGIALQGTTLPTAGIAGRFFIKTTTLELYYDNGTAWVLIGKLAGLDLSAHSSRHASGGADAVSLDASQVTSGVFALDRIPTIPYTKTDFADQALKTTSSVRFATVSVGDLAFKNGWRITEGKDGLILISPSGKKYRFMLEVVE